MYSSTHTHARTHTSASTHAPHLYLQPVVMVLLDTLILKIRLAAQARKLDTVSEAGTMTRHQPTCQPDMQLYRADINADVRPT